MFQTINYLSYILFYLSLTIIVDGGVRIRTTISTSYIGFVTFIGPNIVDLAQLPTGNGILIRDVYMFWLFKRFQLLCNIFLRFIKLLDGRITLVQDLA